MMMTFPKHPTTIFYSESESECSDDEDVRQLEFLAPGAVREWLRRSEAIQKGEDKALAALSMSKAQLSEGRLLLAQWHTYERCRLCEDCVCKSCKEGPKKMALRFATWLIFLSRMVNMKRRSKEGEGQDNF